MVQIRWHLLMSIRNVDLPTNVGWRHRQGLKPSNIIGYDWQMLAFGDGELG